MGEIEDGTRCGCPLCSCACGNDADLLAADGTPLCGCCYADCPDVHDQTHVVVARAVPWAGGWELHVDGVGVTQAEDLSDAADQVRGLLVALEHPSANEARVKVLRTAGPAGLG
ncbi:hypothetical protein GCM10011584_30340 [Nocardioides phosphati]|uniref:Uncharacterized protein n=1 Tax=Nocardioides phosphati TaxID=1867775 RepID=A0ABQ2NCN6_9ACTN|nr:hypothetical protein [Nocardioides phosphati]GGO92889.1 hypothetical protein GCM10011584_30340 [Nocardioides phosphati]